MQGTEIETDRGRRAARARSPAEHGRRGSDRSRAPSGQAGGANDRDAELREEAPRPCEQVLDGSVHGDGDERERGEDRDRVPVNRPEQARRPCQPSPSRQWIVDSSIANANDVDEEERRDADAEERRPQPRRRTSRRPSSSEPLSHGERGEPEHGGGDRGGRQRRRRRAAPRRPGRAWLCASAARSTDCGCERVDDRAGRQHDETATSAQIDEPQPQRQRTWSVKGAVSTFPSSLQLQEQPPGAGRRHEHADLELPGRRRAAGDLRRAEHARAAAHARARRRGCGSSRGCRWRKKIAWASAPNQGVNVGGLAGRPGDVDRHELRLDRLQRLGAVERERVPADLLTVEVGGSGFGLYAPVTCSFPKSWKFAFSWFETVFG